MNQNPTVLYVDNTIRYSFQRSFQAAIHQALIGSPINRIIPQYPPRPFNTYYFDDFLHPLGVCELLETYYEALCQLLTFGNALGAELWPFVSSIFYPMTNLPDLDLQIFKNN